MVQSPSWHKADQLALCIFQTLVELNLELLRTNPAYAHYGRILTGWMWDLWITRPAPFTTQLLRYAAPQYLQRMIT